MLRVAFFVWVIPQRAPFVTSYTYKNWLQQVLLLILTVKTKINSCNQFITFMSTFPYVYIPGHSGVISMGPECHPIHPHVLYISLTASNQLLIGKGRKETLKLWHCLTKMLLKDALQEYECRDIEGTPKCIRNGKWIEICKNWILSYHFASISCALFGGLTWAIIWDNFDIWLRQS